METPFPYDPRKGQLEIIDALRQSIFNNGHCVIQAGTGTGKTICSLSAAISGCRTESNRILYLTRTNSQQKQVIHELRAISKGASVYGVAVQGRRHMCPHIDTDKELRAGNHEELSRLCGLKKKRVLNGDPSACRFYHAMLTNDCSGIIEWARRELPTAEEFVAYSVDRGVCPYEINKLALASAKVVTAPYIYFFNPFIRNSLLEWMGCEIDNLILIVDEAHNLPDYARELKTASLSRGTLKLAEKEAIELRDPEVSEGTSTLDLLKMMNEILEEAINEFVVDDDGLVPPDLLEEMLMTRMRITSRGLLKISSEVVNLGEIIRDKRKKEGKLPRSFLHSVGAFMEFWMSAAEEDYVKLVIGGEKDMLEVYCLDSSLACACIYQVSSSIHMSGTMEPLEEYRDSICLPEESKTLSFPTPFPKENLLILYTDDVTSKYDDFARDKRNLSRMKKYIHDIANNINRNSAVFFPSHNLLRTFVDEGITGDLTISSYIEEKGMAQDDLMDLVSDFKNSDGGGLLLAVSGGRISEGIDFPERELEIAILLGIPYPKPNARTRALLHYYEVKFGKGWEYVVKAPATRKMLQSIGRLIRSETDRGAAIILDKRAIRFSNHISLTLSKDPSEDIRDFFGKKRVLIKLQKRKRKRLKSSAAIPSGNR